ncbi:MAG: trimeric intracellular cation channel family protein [Burkholderiales bacterium]|nr:trimeric intracellular cation channel family protein [Burkholderiales bacterium]
MSLLITPLHVMDYLGVAVFAVSGVLAAGRKHLDWFGVLVIATVTALGGGTLRDLLIDRHPVFWMTDTGYLWTILAATLLTLLIVRFRELPLRALLIADALGLALFAISGARIAETAGYGGIVVVILGTMTGVAGGVFRDMLLAEIPLLLRDGEIYATAAIAGIVVYLVLQMTGFDRLTAGHAGMAAIVVICFAAIFFSLRMPAFRLGESRKQD